MECALSGRVRVDSWDTVHPEDIREMLGEEDMDRGGS